MPHPIQRGPIAAVDVGAHSVRLYVANVRSDGSFECVDNLEVPVALGEDVFRTGQISPAKTQEVGEVLRDFARVMREHCVQRFRAFGTSAVREALNQDVFLHRVEQISGVRIEILPSSEEVRLVFCALLDRLQGPYRLDRRHAVICIVGTGSTELCFTARGLLTHAESARLGTIRMVEQLAEPVSPVRLRQFLDPFIGAVVSGVTRVASGREPDMFVALGATVRALVGIAGETFSNGVAALPRKRFQAVFDRISGRAAVEIAAEFDLPNTVAVGVEPCCHMLERLFDYTTADQLIVADTTTREAILRELAAGEVEAQRRFVRHLLSSVRHLAQRFSADMAHADTVERLASILFRELQDLHQLQERDGVLLRAAALLHDIGLFVSNRAHHKHSMYLVQSFEIPGIRPDEQRILAAVVRYHRKALPSPRHPEFASLPQADRVRVLALAALLRVADA